MSSAGGSDLFASYEQDFNTICDAIRSKVEKQIPNQSGGNTFVFKLAWRTWPEKLTIQTKL